MKTSELTGAALDWAVAKCEGHDIEDATWWVDFGNDCCYSTDWAQGGLIIERENIELEWHGHYWLARIRAGEEWYGATPLIAAMRCYVAYKLEDEVDVPMELL